MNDLAVAFFDAEGSRDTNFLVAVGCIEDVCVPGEEILIQLVILLDSKYPYTLSDIHVSHCVFPTVFSNAYALF